MITANQLITLMCPNCNYRMDESNNREENKYIHLNMVGCDEYITDILWTCPKCEKKVLSMESTPIEGTEAKVFTKA